ncbi:MAG: LLM class flavin-dependent oxidoreductase, partial [Gemmatimonadetes bacterium]|nr:LLM class flavin-dependent oxidoreductase [Gemmatimonadota bacterium]
EVVCAPDEDTAIRRAAPFLLEKYSAYLSWGLRGVTIDSAAAPEEQLRRLAANRFAVGSPAQVIDALLRQHRAGVTHATMRVSWPGMRQADVLAGIELLGRAVLPEVRRLTSGR